MPDAIHIRPARLADLDQLAALFAALWPTSPAAEHAREIQAILSGTAALTMPIALFVAETPSDSATSSSIIGFVEVDLRSHADGCDPAQPVGYIEGWLVAATHRRQQLGARLLATAEDWARSHGCVEVASDALIDNLVSQHAHEALGYEVVDRCVHYRKRL